MVYKGLTETPNLQFRLNLAKTSTQPSAIGPNQRLSMVGSDTSKTGYVNRHGRIRISYTPNRLFWHHIDVTARGACLAGLGQPRKERLASQVGRFLTRFRAGISMPILPKLMFNSAIKLSTGLAIVLAANSALAERLSGTLQAQPPELIEDDSILARQPYSSRGEQLALGGIEHTRARALGTSKLDVVELSGSSDGILRLKQRPSFSSKIGDRYASVTPRNNIVFYTLDSDLQDYVSKLVAGASAEHVAVVAMNPKTGAILAISGKSQSIPDIEYHAGFPAASLFKVVTAAAATEVANIQPDSLIAFRGGTYTLNQHNYYPNPRADRRMMSVGEALGKSCNPVFGHLGVKYLNGSILTRYAQKFGFNRSLGLEAPMPRSSAEIPHDDMFELSRTAAGFGRITISPIHAALIAASIANGGSLPRPYFVDRIVDIDGVTLERTRPEILQRIVEPETAQTLMEMMRNTTTIGTSRKEFMRGGRAALGEIEVAGKTGTLTGSNPQGLTNSFIGAAPIQNPEIALAVITVEPSYSAKASRLARLVMQRYFNIEPGPEIIERPIPRRYTKSSKQKRYTKSSQYRTAKLKSAKKAKTSSKGKTSAVKKSKKSKAKR